MTIPFELLIARLRGGGAKSLLCGEAAYRRIICDPRLFDAISFDGTAIHIGSVRVEVTGEPNHACLHIEGPKGLTAWEGTLQ